jgi:hypothetical protein
VEQWESAIGFAMSLSTHEISTERKEMKDLRVTDFGAAHVCRKRLDFGAAHVCRKRLRNPPVGATVWDCRTATRMMSNSMKSIA